MNNVDSVTLIVGLLIAALGFAVGFGRALRFFTKGIFGIVISVFVCATFGGMIAGIPAVGNRIADLDKSLGNIHLGTIVYYVVLFFAVQIVRIIVVKLIGGIFSADNVVMRVINRFLGMAFTVAAVLLLVLLIFGIFRIFEDTSFVSGIVKDLEGSFLGSLYANNPVKFVQ